MLCQAGHGPLKRVAVGVDGRWQQMANIRVGLIALKACRDPVNLPKAVDMHKYITLPAIRRNAVSALMMEHSQFPLFVYRVTIVSETFDD